SSGGPAITRQQQPVGSLAAGGGGAATRPPAVLHPEMQRIVSSVNARIRRPPDPICPQAAPFPNASALRAHRCAQPPPTRLLRVFSEAGYRPRSRRCVSLAIFA